MTSSALSIFDNEPFAPNIAGVEANGTFKVYIHAWGQFPTSGWRNAQLLVHGHLPGHDAPPDTLAEFDLVADAPPPGTIILDVLTPLEANAICTLHTRIHGVRIHAKNNAITRLVRFGTLPVEPGKEMSFSDFVPIPWAIARGGVDLGG